jgi:hypothetical protein
MMSRGNHVDQLISASLTGDLTDAERLELNAHLVRCETCRATLAAFTAERRILSGMPLAEPPRDLSARVRTGIESGRLGSPWWRRPGGLVAVGASLATVAAAVLAVVLIGKLNFAPVGNASNSPVASVSFAPESAVETSAASAAPTPIPAFALGSGELGYLSLTGAPQGPLRLGFISDVNGGRIDAGTVTGPPIAAALSPNGQWLAYITQKGESGANEVWALHLADGRVVPLGCTEAASFTDRLAWSPDGQYLAFTLIATDLGPNSGCPANDGATETVDAWFYDVTQGERIRLTRSGDAYSASFQPGAAGSTLVISHAAESPWSEAVPLAADPTNIDKVEGVFMPLFSPDGSRAIFWNGSMTPSGGSWHFSLGGMPQLSKDFRSAGPASPWVGTPLFSDLTPVGGEAFASGQFAWSPDSDQFAFWDGAWTGVPQSADGTYPSQREWYVGTVNDLLSATSRHGHGPTDDSWTVDVTFGASNEIAVTLGISSAGVGDPPSAVLEIIGACCGGEPRTIGGGVEPPPWDGPAVYGH